MRNVLRELLATAKEIRALIKQLRYEVSRVKELQAVNGMRLDVLQQRLLSHEAFIDEKAGCFAERFREDIESEASV